MTATAETLTPARTRKHQCHFMRDRPGGAPSQCQARASYRVGVKLRGKHNRQSMTIWLAPICCNGCRKTMRVDHVVNDRGWQRWFEACQRQEKFRAKRGRTRLTFVRLNDPDLPPGLR